MSFKCPTYTVPINYLKSNRCPAPAEPKYKCKINCPQWRWPICEPGPQTNMPYIPLNLSTEVNQRACYWECESQPVQPIACNIMWSPPLGEVPGLNFPQRPFPTIKSMSQFYKCQKPTDCDTVLTHDKYMSNDYYNLFPSNVSY